MINHLSVRDGISGRGCRISRVRDTRSNMPAKYQDGAAGSHGSGTPDRTCLENIRTGQQDLTGKEHQIVHAYELSGWGCMISRVRNNSSNIQDLTVWELQIVLNRTCLRGISSGLQDLTGSGFLRGIRMGLQDLTGWEHQIEHEYEV